MIPIFLSMALKLTSSRPNSTESLQRTHTILSMRRKKWRKLLKQASFKIYDVTTKYKIVHFINHSGFTGLDSNDSSAIFSTGDFCLSSSTGSYILPTISPMKAIIVSTSTTLTDLVTL